MFERTEKRNAKKSVRPHVEPGKSDTENGPETRDERLDVTHLPQVLADWRRAPGLLVTLQLVVRATRLERIRAGFCRQHARRHRVVRALDTRQVHEAGRAADKRAAGKN